MRRIISLASAGCLIGQFASAHAFLDRASPAVGSEASGSPPVVTLSYTEPVEPLFSSIRVTDTGGSRFDDGKPWTQDGGRMLCVAVKHLPSGAYNVEWHATSVDTHKTEGHFSFIVKP